jgi:AcrR family transcriptional regulator
MPDSGDRSGSLPGRRRLIGGGLKRQPPSQGQLARRGPGVPKQNVAAISAPRADATRRNEVLRTAAALIATSGFRTSLQDIADAAGILPGSLYHHFESKEAILVELVRRYHADLDRIAERAQARLDETDGQSVDDNIVELASEIAQCAVEHRAALHMSFYEAPSANPELVELLHRPPEAIQRVMLQTLRAGRWSGYIRPDLDLTILADRICQTMLHVGLDVIRHKARPAQVAAVSCRIMLDGLASRMPADTKLDRSPARALANELILTWANDSDQDVNDRATHIRAVARKEFGRKGYEVTTVRDIASAAGLGTGTVYRLIGSKEALLASIMMSFGKRVGEGWEQILRCKGTPVEKLDALAWLDINALDQFSDEFRIQLAWMRQSPPDTSDIAFLFTTRVKQLKSVLSEGLLTGSIRIDSPTKDILTRCVMDVLWMPENIQRAIGMRAALDLSRDTMLRGVTDRR